MKARRFTLLLFVVCLPSLAVAAGLSNANPDPQASEIVTDRPDITEASTVVPKESLQVESGLTWTLDHGTRTIDASETLIRYGAGSRTEVRFTAPSYFNGTGHNAESGLGDLSIGFKQQLGPLPTGVDLSLIGSLSLPSGRMGISSRGFDPSVKLPWSKQLTNKWSIGGMQSLFWNSQEGGRNLTWQSTFYAERQFRASWYMFLEYDAELPHRSRSRQLIHNGAAYRPTPRQQVDVHFGVGLTPVTPSRFVAFGYSFRIDGIGKRHS
jgi:hypothetical protein